MTLRFGHGESIRGRYFYSNGVRFECGAIVLFDEDIENGNAFCLVEFSGSVLGAMGQDATLEVLRALAAEGFKCTRVDVAIDWQGHQLGLIDEATASCMRGELVGAKVFEQKLIRRGFEVISRGVCIGRQGKLGSGRYIRMYDKGLEQGGRVARLWERFEVVFSDALAMEVGDMVAHFGLEAAANAALGSVDFRVCTGDQHVKRRPRCAWWSEVVEGFNPARVKLVRTKTRLDSYAGWLKRCVLPALRQMCERGGVGLEDLWRDLCGDISPEDDARLRPVVWEWLLSRRLIDAQA